MSTVTKVFNGMPSVSEMDQLFNFVEAMSEEDPIFKSALSRVLNGEEHETVVSELLCDGNMKEIIDANVADKDEEGGLFEAMVDIKVINEANNLLTKLKAMELESPDSESVNVSE